MLSRFNMNSLNTNGRSHPLIAEVGVIALMPEHWSNHWMGRHQLLTRLAGFFHVVWVNPANEWRKILRTRKEPSMQRAITGQIPGFFVYDPEFWLPKLYRPEWLARLSFNQQLRRGLRLLTSRGCRKIILYLWRPNFADALHSIPFNLSCYHISDEYSFSDVDLPVGESERQLIAKVDQVFIHSPELLAKKGKINPHTVFVPNGVDYEAYSKPVAEPSDLASIPHPRIGYTGIIKRTLDWPLLLHLTLQHPEWHFVFVGPQNPHHPEISGPIQELSSHRNVHFLGAKSTRELAAYPQHMDVCIMPYRQNSHSTKFGYPLKLHEYLASGRPAVGSPLRTLQEFAHVIKLARTGEEWSKALSDSLSPAARSATQIEARQSVALQHDWNKLVGLIARTMCARLGPAYLERFEKNPISEPYTEIYLPTVAIG